MVSPGKNGGKFFLSLLFSSILEKFCPHFFPGEITSPPYGFNYYNASWDERILFMDLVKRDAITHELPRFHCFQSITIQSIIAEIIDQNISINQTGKFGEINKAIPRKLSKMIDSDTWEPGFEEERDDFKECTHCIENRNDLFLRNTSLANQFPRLSCENSYGSKIFINIVVNKYN